MENRNAIKIVQHNAVTKQELLNIITENCFHWDSNTNMKRE